MFCDKAVTLGRYALSMIIRRTEKELNVEQMIVPVGMAVFAQVAVFVVGIIVAIFAGFFVPEVWGGFGENLTHTLLWPHLTLAQSMPDWIIATIALLFLVAYGIVLGVGWANRRFAEALLYILTIHGLLILFAWVL